MFSSEHFTWIALCSILITVMTVLSVKMKFSFKISAIIMALISLVSEGSKIISNMQYVNGENPNDGMVIDAGALPFHLCSILIFAFFYLPFSKNEKLKNYLTSLVVPVSLIGATLAILMATSGTDFTKPEPYQCFVYHAGMIWFSLYLMFTKQVDLGLKAWIRNLVSLFSLAIVMIWVNGLLQVYDTNFLYVVRPPVENLPILNLNNGWFVYFLTIIACGFLGITLVHLPYIIKEKKKS